MSSHSRDDPNRSDWVHRAFGVSLAQGTALVGIGLAFSWLATYSLGGAGRVPPHWFYVPILLAAARFGVPGAALTALTAGVLAGPLMPLDVASGSAQPFSDWVGRMGFFLANGLIMALVIGRLKAALERELDLTREELELARHKETVVQSVSHEFLTPLTVIRGAAEMFAEPGMVSEKAHPLVAGLNRSAQRLENLINVVLAASEALIEPGHRRDARVVLRDLCKNVAAAADTPEGERIHFEAAPDAEVVFCDPALLGLPLQAVIDNALKFSPASTQVVISARRLSDTVEICVRDAGPGMTESDRAAAFAPFTRKDERKQGMGLGLFAARKTVELLGGTIELRQADGSEGGTDALITIPQRD